MSKIVESGPERAEVEPMPRPSAWRSVAKRVDSSSWDLQYVYANLTKLLPQAWCSGQTNSEAVVKTGSVQP